MFSKKKIALSFAVVLSIALPASAATKQHHHHVTPVHPAAIYNMTIPAAAGGSCTASGGPACSSACTGSGPCAPPDSW
jgi:hypothetical protein